MGNIVNRVFDSSGPEGKVRGTPQQIIDKYNQLARDAQLSNDRVAAENFQQHAEHYTRLLGEAQREQDARREQQEQQNRERQAQREQSQPSEPKAETAAQDEKSTESDVIDLADVKGDSGLVDTPEAAPAPKRRAPRKPRAKAEASQETPANDGPDSTEQPSVAE